MSEPSSIQLTTLSEPPPAALCNRTVNAGSVGSAGALEAEDGTAADPQGQRLEFSLPPVDGGKDAWLFLAACFTLEALVWGFPFAFGVFQDYYSTHEPFAGSSSIAVIGTCAMGIMYLAIAPVMGVQRLYPRAAAWSPVAGLLIMCLALSMSSFSTTVTHLVVTQGILYAVGGTIAYSPCILYVDEWFVRRKGLAYGIMWSGTGLAGFVLPLVLEHLLDAYGYRTTLRAWALALFVLAAPLSRFIRPRLPASAATRFRPFAVGFAATRAFALYQAASVVQALGFFLPGVYLPSYARAALGAGPLQAALTVLLVNVASVFGCVAMGSLIDRLHVTTCLLVSTAGATVGTFLLWGFATNLPVLYLFCIIWGLFSASYSSTWPGIMRQVADAYRERRRSDDSGSVDPTMIFGFLAAGRGIGNIVSGPLSEILLQGMPWQGRAAGGYGSGYGVLIVFTGVTAFVGGSSFLWRRIGWL